MEKILLVEYPKCTTCQKAKKWLSENGVEYKERHIVDQRPSQSELEQWISHSGLPLRKFFNTSGQLYRSMELSKKLTSMEEEEQLALLASNGMLVKRPIVVTENKVFVGFKPAEWEELKQL